MKCEAVYAHSSEFSVRKMCRALGLCEASYYQWRRGEKRRCEKRAAEQALIKQIKAVFGIMQIYIVGQQTPAYKGNELLTQCRFCLK